MCICKRNTCYPSIQISFLYVACVSGPLKPSSRNSHFFIWRFEHIPSRKSPFLWLQTISKCWVYGLLGYPHRTHEDISVSGTQTRRIAGNFRENTLEIMKHVELIDSRNFVSVSNQEAFQFMDVVLHGQFQVLQVILLLVTEAVTPRNLCPQLTTPQKPRNFPFPCKTSTFGLSQLSLLDFHGFYPPSWGLALHPITLKRASKISPQTPRLPRQMAGHLWLRHPRQVLADPLGVLVGHDHVLVVRTLLVLGEFFGGHDGWMGVGTCPFL